MKNERIKRVALMLLFLICIVAKTVLFVGLISSRDGVTIAKYKWNVELILPHIMMLLLILIPGYLFKGKRQFKYLVTVDTLYSILLFADMIIFRSSRDFIGLKTFVFSGLNNPVSDFVLRFSVFDILFFIDIIAWIIVYKKVKSIEELKRSIITVAITFVIGISIITIKDKELGFMDVSWNAENTMKAMMPIGYHYYETKDTISKVTKKTTEDELKRVDDWLAWNKEELEPNTYYGAAEGKNLIFVQIESMENFMIGKEVYGQEITPVLNKLIKEGLYFNNIYEQNNGGNSVDCDFMVNTSVLPLGESITFLTHPEVKYDALPRVLNRFGYYTVTSHAVPGANYNWGMNHKNGFGFDEIWDSTKYTLKEYVGGYRSDKELYEETVKMLKEVKNPYYAMVATATSHGPFYMQDEYKYLDLPDELNENRLGEYFQAIHFADKQIGVLVDLLEKNEMLDDTILVFYGDHGGVHKYYSHMIEDAPLEGDWWKEDELKIPLLIYSKGVEPKVVEEVGGQVDIMPTVLSLMGIKNDNMMGRNLLNTNRNATVINNRQNEKVIIGEVKSPEEEQRLREAYDIGRIIIENKYFEKKELVSGE